MIKILIAIFILSVAFIQPVFAETTRLKQWIAPPECVIEGEILTEDECNELLNPVQPTPNSPVESPISDTTSQELPAQFWQISSILAPFIISSPSPVNESGVRIVDRSETHSQNQESLMINLSVLLLIIFGVGLLAFTSYRRSTNLSKEDKFDKISRRVSSFWTRKAK